MRVTHPLAGTSLYFPCIVLSCPLLSYLTSSFSFEVPTSLNPKSSWLAPAPASNSFPMDAAMSPAVEAKWPTRLSRSFRERGSFDAGSFKAASFERAHKKDQYVVSLRQERLRGGSDLSVASSHGQLDPAAGAVT